MVSEVATAAEQIRRNAAAMELIHQLGGTVETRPSPYFEERDWETEAYLDQWVGLYVKNVAEHYHDILRAPHIGCLEQAVPGCAVAVVGAGPSLDKNADQLRGFPGLIFACDRAAKALTARGIKPDLVVCVDPRPAVMAEMLNYPENRGQRLALSVVADPEVARVWRGRLFYMSTQHEGTQFFDRVLPELFPGMPGTQACGNVGNTALQLAAVVGAAKVVLVGQDYAYTGGRMHCADWVRLPTGAWMAAPADPAYEADKLAQRSGKVVEGGLETYGPFLSYRETMRKMISAWALDVVNATEGGILTDLPQSPLAAVVAELRSQKFQADEARALLDQATGGAL